MQTKAMRVRSVGLLTHPPKNPPESVAPTPLNQRQIERVSSRQNQLFWVRSRAGALVLNSTSSEQTIYFELQSRS
jgi:hypothetical protein